MELLTTLAVVATLSVPARTSANVSLAADGRTVVAVWSAALPQGPTDIYASVSRDSGTTFSEPVRVNSTAGDARVNGEQPPRAVLTPGRGATPRIVVVWTAGGKAGTTLQSARSDDGGKTFGASATVPGSDGAGSRGWQSAVADQRGQVHALWLDHRGLAAPAGAAAAPHVHGAARDGVAMAQKSALYTSVVGQPASVTMITSGVCYCCKTAIATGGDGTIFSAWRQVYAGSIRDIALSFSKDGGRTFTAPAKVSDDRWVINGCPDDGPALAVDAQGRVHVVWPTAIAGAGGAQTLALFHASSRDGQVFTRRERIPTEGMPHHPQMAIDGSGAVIVAWEEAGQGGRKVAFARGTSDAAGRVEFQRMSNAPAGTYPVVVNTPEGIVAAWTAGAEIRIGRAGR